MKFFWVQFRFTSSAVRCRNRTRNGCVRIAKATSVLCRPTRLEHSYIYYCRDLLIRHIFLKVQRAEELSFWWQTDGLLWMIASTLIFPFFAFLQLKGKNLTGTHPLRPTIPWQVFHEYSLKVQYYLSNMQIRLGLWGYQSFLKAKKLSKKIPNQTAVHARICLFNDFEK